MTNTTVIYDVKGLLRDLEALQPGMRRELVREAKKPAKRIADNIKRHIPETAPLSGMSREKNPNGRLAWGAGKPANQVQIKFRSSRSRTTAITSLVSIWVTSPATAMADVAGKGNLRKATTLSRRYYYKDDTRRHAIRRGMRGMNGGRDFVANLQARGGNDFVYPAVGDSVDDASREIKLIIDSYARKVNRKLG